MRVTIESDAQTIEGLTEELKSLPNINVESYQAAQDLAEQKFGFAEVSAVIAIVNGVVELASALKHFADEFFKRTHETKPQTLRLRSAIGTVIVEIAPGTTLDELRRDLSPLSVVD